MRKLIVRVDGKEIKGAVAVSYLEVGKKFRVVTKLNNKLAKADYYATSVVIDVTASDVEYKEPINCMYKKSSVEFTGIKGRYGCISIDDAGYVKIVDKNLNWMLLKIGKTEVDRVRKLAEDELGSLYVEIDNSRFGKIYKRTLDRAVDYSEFIWSS